MAQHARAAWRRPTRRTFIQGLGIGAAAAGLGIWPSWSWGQSAGRRPVRSLSGTEFDLTIGETPVDITGSMRTAITVNGSLPAPTLYWREGDTVTMRVKNTLLADASIHWHGILVPANMDGVPGLSFNGIQPGETFVYRFLVRQHGTYWYHSHSAFQEQQGLYGSLIIESRQPSPFQYDREHVILLSDWSDEAPEALFAKLKKQAGFSNFSQRTVGDFIRDVERRGFKATVAERAMWGRMRMRPTDLADVTGHVYAYLMNGQAPDGNWTALFKPGERVRLRFINGSAMTYFDVRIPGLKMTVIAADGNDVHPVTVDEFRIATAETFDVLVEPAGQDAFTIFAQSADRTDFARGTLAVREGLSAPVPGLDLPQLLTMADMGMGGPMAGMHGMGGTQGMEGMQGTPGTKSGGASQTPSDPHAGHTMPSPAGPTTPPPAHDMAGMNDTMQSHPASERGNPLVDNQAMSPVARLDDPGVGLRGNGRRVLTYADLRNVFDDPDGREPSRTIELHLTGHMERFAWSFDGLKFSEAKPIRLTYGERVRIVLVNDTMMSHPIHLHGMWSDVEDEHGAFHVRKHTVDMQPGTKRSYRVRADALGRWAYHCHLLYHMEAGMFREVVVDE